MPGEVLPPPPEPALSPEPRENSPWSAWDVVLVALLALAGITLFAFVMISVARRLPEFRGIPAGDLTADPKIIVPAQFAAYLLVIVFMVILARNYGRSLFQAVRWNWPSQWVGYIFAGFALALAVQLTSILLPIPKQLPIERYFRDAAGAWLMALFGTFVAPFVEELFFRGLLYPVLARRLGLPVAVGLTAAAFAIVHESQLAHAWGPLLLIFIVGMVLTMVRAQSGSVARSFLIHVGYNMSLFTLLYFGTDHFRHLERLAQ